MIARLAPQVGHPVVVDGTKYRIRLITRDGARADCRTSFGNRWATVTLADLTWDPIAGVWRVSLEGAA